jgi:hypothetical protein
MVEARPRIPNPVRRQLRKEVGFGCPIPDCRSPFLTLHHFDPTWAAVKLQCAAEQRNPTSNDHNPEGMIALCRECHGSADQGVFSPSYLHSLKMNTYSAQSVKGRVPWFDGPLVVQLGNNFAAGLAFSLRVNGETLIDICNSRDADGMAEVSFMLRSDRGNEVARMDQNVFQTESSQLHDMECNASATSIKIWTASRNVGLELSFARLNREEAVNLIDETITIPSVALPFRRHLEEGGFYKDDQLVVLSFDQMQLRDRAGNAVKIDGRSIGYSGLVVRFNAFTANTSRVVYSFTKLKDGHQGYFMDSEPIIDSD